ncbi:MAG: hypothetical protein ACPHCI_07255 [Solirubrobacterales bacterium]
MPTYFLCRRRREAPAATLTRRQGFYGGHMATTDLYLTGMERALSNSRVLPRLVTLGISVIALVVLALPVNANAADPAAAGPSTTHPEYTETILSNEQDFSRWAFVKRRVIAYSQPKNKGRKVRKLTTRTPDRTHDLVLVLRERKYVDGTVLRSAAIVTRPSSTATTSWSGARESVLASAARLRPKVTFTFATA